MNFYILSLFACAYSLPLLGTSLLAEKGASLRSSALSAASSTKPFVAPKASSLLSKPRSVLAKASGANKDLFETPDLVLRPELASKPGATAYFGKAKKELQTAQNELVWHDREIQSAMNEINKQHQKLNAVREANGEIHEEIKQMKNVEAAKVKAQAVVNELRSKRLEAVKAHNQLEQLGVPKSQLSLSESELANAREDLENAFKLEKPVRGKKPNWLPFLNN